MEILNNKYKIIEELKQGRLYSSYKAIDLQNNEETIVLNILNSKNISKKFISFCIESCSSLGSLNKSGLVPVYDFGLLSTIDNKKVPTKSYYYTNKFLKDSKKLCSIKFEDKEKLLDIFVKLCQIVNYLNVQGCDYNYLNDDNVYYDEENQSIILKDILSVEIAKHEFSEEQENREIFNLCEAKDKKDILGVQIYSLGIILLILCLKNKGVKFNAKKLAVIVQNIDSNYGENLYLQRNIDKDIYDILKNMIQIDPRNRYQSITEVILEINKKFNKDYKPYRKELLEKLNFDTRLVGRSRQIDSIINICETMSKCDIPDRAIMVHGETGIGKTRFLKHLEYSLKLKNLTVYSTMDVKKNKFFSYIIRKIANDASHEILGKYAHILVNFIPEIENELNIEISSNNLYTRDRLRIISEMSNFIHEVVQDKPVIVLIDDLHNEDEFTLKYILYTLNKYNKDNKLLIVFAYCDGECFKNRSFIEFIKKIKNTVKNDVILKELDIDETGEMIKNILCKSNITETFTNVIYQTTKGNPLFIEEVLRNIYNRKYIYINDESGKWYNKFELNNLKLPSTMYDMVKDQINEFDGLSTEILSVMSVFNKAVSIELIFNIVDEDRLKIIESMEGLYDRGIICKKIEDMGFAYDFYNKFLKLYLYENIKIKEKINKHQLAYKALEQYYVNGSVEYLEEIIYHLEKAENKEKLKYYCIKNAQRMLYVNNKKDAISNYLKILESYKEHEYNEEILRILLKIGELYKEENDEDKAIECFLKASRIGKIKNYVKVTIDSMILVVSILLVKKKFDKIKEYQKEIETLLDAVDYEDGNISYMHIKATVYMQKEEYKKSYKICKKGMALCKNNNLGYRFKFCNMLSQVLIVENKPDKALPILIENLELCTDKYPLDKLRILNGIGLIYSDFYEDMDKAIEYYEMVYKIGEDNDLDSYATVGLLNIAFVQYSLDEYENAYETFKMALERAKKYGTYSYELYCNIYLGSILYKFGRYSEAYRYYILSKSYVDGVDVETRDKGQFYILAYKLHYLCGQKKEAKEFLDIAKESSGNTGVLLRKQAEICEIIYNLQENNCDIEKALKKLNLMVEDVVNKDTIILILLNGIVNFYLNKNYTLAKDVLTIVNNYKEDILFKRNITTINFFNHVLYEKIDIKILYDILGDFKDTEENFLLWIILISIGDYFLDNGEYDYAMIYYFEACGAVIDLTLQIPKNLRLGFIKSNNMEEPFVKFKALLDYYKEGREVINLDEYDFNLNSHESMETLFKEVLNEDLIRNKTLSRGLKEVNSKLYGLEIKEESELFRKFTSDTLYNIKLVLKYLSYITISNRAVVLIEENKEFKVLQSTVNNIHIDYNIVNTVRDTKKPFVLKEEYMEYLNLDNCKISTSQTKGVMCVPIIMENTIKDNTNRKANIYYVDNIKGYIYLESDKILNEINEETLNISLNLSKVLGVLIDKHLSEVNSSVDKVTGVMTRKYLEKSILMQLEACNECNSSFSMLMFDVDFFKGVNDRFGHRKGDEVLKTICEVCMKNIRETDICGRYGGEEFIAILPNTVIEEAFKISERVRTSVENADILQGKREVTISIGISNYPEHATTYEELIEKADQALYAAKNSGRNKSVVWNESFKGNLTSTNKINGVISGNLNKDIRTVSTMIDIIEIVGENQNKLEVLYVCLGRIIEIMECKSAAMFLLDDNKIESIHVREAHKTEWSKIKNYDKNCMINAIKDRKTITTVEFENKLDIESGVYVPTWTSIIMTPIIQKGIVKAILYLSADCKKKEFGIEDANILSMIGKIILPRI
ncbi:MAG: diguanylate cyclase [Clostridium sp.]